MQLKAPTDQASGSGSSATAALPVMRELPIRWRVLSLAALNALVVVVFAAVIWDGTRALTSARNELRQTRAGIP